MILSSSSADPNVEYKYCILSLKIFALSERTALTGSAVAVERYFLGFKNVMIPTASNDKKTTKNICFHQRAIRSKISGIERIFRLMNVPLLPEIRGSCSLCDFYMPAETFFQRDKCFCPLDPFYFLQFIVQD